MKKIVIAITGASGSIYAKLLLDKLQQSGQWQELSVIFTENAKQVWQTELSEDVDDYHNQSGDRGRPDDPSGRLHGIGDEPKTGAVAANASTPEPTSCQLNLMMGASAWLMTRFRAAMPNTADAPAIANWARRRAHGHGASTAVTTSPESLAQTSTSPISNTLAPFVSAVAQARSRFAATAWQIASRRATPVRRRGTLDSPDRARLRRRARPAGRRHRGRGRAGRRRVGDGCPALVGVRRARKPHDAKQTRPSVSKTFNLLKNSRDADSRFVTAAAAWRQGHDFAAVPDYRPR